MTVFPAAYSWIVDDRGVRHPPNEHRSPKQTWIVQIPLAREQTPLPLAFQGEGHSLWGCPVTVVGVKGRRCLYAALHTHKKSRTQPLPKYLYISIGARSCVFLYTNARVITLKYIYGENVYNSISKTGQAFAKAIRLGMGGGCFLFPLT